MRTKRIAVLGYDDVQALDIAGPLDAFDMANRGTHTDRPNYQTLLLGITNRSFRSEAGINFKPNAAIDRVVEIDTLIIPGGRSLRTSEMGSRVATAVKRFGAPARRLASVCTGVYGIAPTGLLDGRTVTTHWRFASDLARRFPKLRVDSNALFLKDGRYYSSAGITAGIDLALALIEEDLGPTWALAVARELVVYVKRPGGQEQFSEALQFQAQTIDAFKDLPAFVMGHLRGDLSIEKLAAKVCLCPRHFSRKFKTKFGMTPADFVERIRLDEARRRLLLPEETIGSVAASVGFASLDSFRRAFERRFKVAPSMYRKCFNSRYVSD
jgi:transcriptional regulator GlxA family with amidase domain